ncbi:hypothetical protein AB1N83_011587 [Pleurotus pulmonarius]
MCMMYSITPRVIVSSFFIDPQSFRHEGRRPLTYAAVSITQKGLKTSGQYKYSTPRLHAPGIELPKERLHLQRTTIGLT